MINTNKTNKTTRQQKLLTRIQLHRGISLRHHRQDSWSTRDSFRPIALPFALIADVTVDNVGRIVNRNPTRNKKVMRREHSGWKTISHIHLRWSIIIIVRLIHPKRNIAARSASGRNYQRAHVNRRKEHRDRNYTGGTNSKIRRKKWKLRTRSESQNHFVQLYKISRGHWNQTLGQLSRSCYIPLYCTKPLF